MTMEYGIRRIEWDVDQKCWLHDGHEPERFTSERQATLAAAELTIAGEGGPYVWEPVIIPDQSSGLTSSASAP
jgi:hypothetical protein